MFASRGRRRIPVRPAAVALAVVALVLTAGPTVAVAQLCARVTTSLGTFEAELEHELAPLAVASFVSLAEGSRGWIDFAEGRVRRDPFFEGITFHRVIPGFVIQGGSPNGMGTDGPGYSFPDEFVPSLRHDGAYVLSMANSGPNSNGSQFFVTLDATPWLDDVHTVFGKVTSGREVVDAIGAVETGPGNRPLEPVVIEKVEILRKDAAAQAFDPAAQGLATVASADGLSLTRDAGGAFALGFERRRDAAYHVFTGTSFPLGELLDEFLDLGAAGPPSIDVSATVAEGPRAFFQVIETAYPPPLPVPATLEGKTITFALDSQEPQELVAAFTTETSGTWTLLPNDVSGPVTARFWRPGPYRADFVFDFGNLTVWRFADGKIGLDSMTEGRYQATALLTNGSERDLIGDITLTETESPAP